MELTLTLTHLQSFSTSAIASKQPGTKAPHLTCTCHLLVDAMKSLMVGISSGDILVWKSKKSYSQTTMVQGRVLSGHKGRIWVMKCVPLPRSTTIHVVFSGSADRTIRMWNPWVPETDRPCIQTLVGHNGTVTSIEYDNGTLISSSTDHTIRVWRPQDERAITTYPWYICTQVVSESGDWVNSLSIRPGDAMTLFVGDGKGNLSAYQAMGRQQMLKQCRPKQHLHERGISHVLFVPQENFVVTLSFDNTVQVHDASNGNGFFAVENPNRCRYTGVAWDHARQEMLLVDAIGYLQVWNVYMEKCLKVVRIRRGELHQISVHSDDLIVVGAQECVEVWNVHRQVQSRECQGHTGPIVGLARLQQERMLCSASLDNTIRCWSIGSMSCVAVLREAASEIASIAHVPDTNLVLSGLDNGVIHLWNVDTGSTLVLKAHTNMVTCMAIARVPRRHRDYLITSGFDGRVIIWDLTNRKTVNPCQDHELQHAGPILEKLTVAFNPSSGTVLAGGNDCLVHIWDLETYESRGRLQGHTAAVTSLAFDANIVFTGADDGTVRIWDGYYRHCLWTLDDHADSIRCMMFLPDCQSLVTCAADGAVFLWDYTTRSVRKRFTHAQHGRCMLYDDELHQIFVGTDQAGIVIFSIPDELYAIGNTATA
ncbi:WD domain, G-beta repeat [Plasmodiophora brassicae]